MPKFLEKKLKKQYGKDSDVPYKIMNKLGLMRGSKETAKGRAAEKKHQGDYRPSARLRGLGGEKKKHRVIKGPTFAAAMNRS